MATPSVTESAYRWSYPPGPLSVAPAWMRTLLERPSRPIRRWPARVRGSAQGRRRLESLADAVRTSPEGRRNKWLYWATRRALEEGIPARYAERALSRAGVASGLSERETVATVRSALEAAG